MACFAQHRQAASPFTRRRTKCRLPVRVNKPDHGFVRSMACTGLVWTCFQDLINEYQTGCSQDLPLKTWTSLSSAAYRNALCLLLRIETTGNSPWSRPSKDQAPLAAAMHLTGCHWNQFKVKTQNPGPHHPQHINNSMGLVSLCARRNNGWRPKPHEISMHHGRSQLGLTEEKNRNNTVKQKQTDMRPMLKLIQNQFKCTRPCSKPSPLQKLVWWVESGSLFKPRANLTSTRKLQAILRIS